MSFRLKNPSGLSAEVSASGALRWLRFGDLLINLFAGSEVEGGVTNLYLRRHGERIQWLPLLGPNSPGKMSSDGSTVKLSGEGLGICYTVSLTLAESDPAWFWHLKLENLGDDPCTLDLIYVQDLGLAHYGLVRSNEYFVSQYLDHTPLCHPQLGWVLATRQNLPQDGRHPWCLIGSLRQGVSFATDALQVVGLELRAGRAPIGIVQGLAGVRRQHEHALAAIQDAPIRLAPRAGCQLGFFGWVEADHPKPSSAADLELADRVIGGTVRSPLGGKAQEIAKSWFATAPLLEAQELDEAELADRFESTWRQVERDREGRLLSFFTGKWHVVLKTKELCVLRPHGHILRTGKALLPEEASLTSTVWMAGIFHSQLTQGHVARNLLLSTARGYLGLLRARGLRVFVELAGTWYLLDVPSAFAISPDDCRWLYRHSQGLIECRSAALCDPRQALSFELSFLKGEPCRCLIVLHLALGGDDGDAPSQIRYEQTAAGISLRPPLGSELAQRFPQGSFELQPLPGTEFERIGGDELVFVDGCSRHQPYLGLLVTPAPKVGFKIFGRLVTEEHDSRISYPISLPAPDQPGANDLSRLLEILPWFLHNATIHYLSPRGLEQYTGGGWGTRDVTQGPVEMLLALGCFAPVREIVRLVFASQNPNGDWPQWFSFFNRDRHIRADYAHGDIVFWPLLALGRYLVASEDASILDETVPFFHPDETQAECASLWQHVERALHWVATQYIPGTCLVRYGRGDWDDSLEPADPALENELVSSFTVGLHYQSLTTLAEGLCGLGLSAEARRLKALAAEVLADFQRYLIADGVLAGLVWLRDGRIEHLMHPQDRITGVSFRLVPMVQAILAGLFTAEQTQAHLSLIRRHLWGPDGARLADKPFVYRGGETRLFERAETSSFFGREIGLMYTHAHLRYAEALAQVGEAAGFLEALNLANPIDLPSRVPQAACRQSNCYYTSSDAAFADRYAAQAQYDRLLGGEVALEGGWRIYSSGPGVFLRLVVSHLLGLRLGKTRLIVDPVVPKAFDGLQVELELLGHRIELVYHIDQCGAGPKTLCFNGADLPFTRCFNPYRMGGAAVPMTAIRDKLRSGLNRLVVWIA
jgi:cellobiose phosphorylase